MDTTSQPDKMYFRSVLYDALYEAFDCLTYREQRTVAKHLGFCDTCWSTKTAVLINGAVEYKAIKPLPFEAVSHSASRKSDKASERTYYTALNKMRKYLQRVKGQLGELKYFYKNRTNHSAAPACKKKNRKTRRKLCGFFLHLVLLCLPD